MATKTKSTRRVGNTETTNENKGGDAQNENTGGDAQNEKKSKKPEFDFATAIDADGNAIALDDNGRLTAVPANWTTDFRPLQRAAFASKELLLNHKLYLFDKESASRAARREELVERIEEASTGLSPEKKMLKKHQRLLKQLAALKAELEEQGVELEA